MGNSVAMLASERFCEGVRASCKCAHFHIRTGLELPCGLYRSDLGQCMNTAGKFYSFSV